MLRKLDSRGGHVVLLLAVAAALTLPNLGAHSLWDVDEGLNAEAAREMLVRGDWVTPTFNGELRSAKPVLLYWLQMLAYLVLGVNEAAARLPSVLAAWASVLLTYDLARRMFDPRTGLLAGLILASSFEFVLLAHAATPDAMLLACTVLAFHAFWRGTAEGGRSWFVPTGIAAGFAVLAKGPAGGLLPGMVIGLFFWWNAQWRRLLDWRLAAGAMACALVALPWYVAVSVATGAAFVGDFLGKHNVYRFLQPMEGHSGPVYYHAVGLLVLFAPWSVFLGVTLWHALRESRSRRPGGTPVPGAPRGNSPEPEAAHRRMEAYRLLVCWCATYLVFFSLAATKLPNYVFPLYPALAILTARPLAQWAARRIQAAAWVATGSAVGLALVGVLTGLGLALAGGSLRVPIDAIPTLAGLERWAWLGAIPVIAAAAALLCYRRDARTGAIGGVTAAAVIFAGGIAAGPPVALDSHKAPRALVTAAGLAAEHSTARVASFGWFQPTLVFYVGREVQRLNDLDGVQAFLAQPQPAYLFVPAGLWEKTAPAVRTPYAEVARRHDFYRRTDVVVVRNHVATVPEGTRTPR